MPIGLTGAIGPGQADDRSGSAGAGRFRGLARRFSWGLADQAVSSLTNFAVSLYVARTLGAVQFGAFGLAYVTYSLVLNASRGLASDPLVVRYSAVPAAAWRRAVADATGTATATGLTAGAALLAAAMLMSGTTRGAFLAMGLTMPGLMLQDCWRYAFFACGRGGHAFLNDTVWALALAPALLILRATGHQSVFWFVLTWGAAANLAAVVGPLQARVRPRLTQARAWITHHRDLAYRYLTEETLGSVTGQIRAFGLVVIAGLAAVGYVQAVSTLMGPFLVIMMGVTLVTVPEAARVLKHSPQRLRLFCVIVASALALAAAAWGAVLLVSLPRGLGEWLLGRIWRPTDPLILPMTIAIIGSCICAGATAGLRALGAAKRSLRAQLAASGTYVVCMLTGAALGGAEGAVRGGALAMLLSACMWWWQLNAALGKENSDQGTPRTQTQHRAPRLQRRKVPG